MRGHLQGFLLREGTQAVGLGNNARVCGKEAVDIGVYLAHVGVQGRGQGDGGRVGAPAAQRRHVVIPGNPLKTGDDGDLAVLDSSGDTLGNHAGDMRGTEAAVGLNAGLGARVGVGLDAELIDGHGQESHRDAFTRRQEDVHFAFRRLGREGSRRLQKVIRRVTHGRYDDDNAVSRVVRVHDALGYALHGPGIGDR